MRFNFQINKSSMFAEFLFSTQKQYVGSPHPWFECVFFLFQYFFVNPTFVLVMFLWYLCVSTKKNCNLDCDLI